MKNGDFHASGVKLAWAGFEPMYLSREEERIASGELGDAKRAALSILVDIGDFFEAEKLVDITSAHLSGVSYFTGGEGIIEQLKSFIALGGKVNVYTTLNPCGMDLKNYSKMELTEKFVKKQRAIINLYKQLGVTISCTCTPYEIGNIARFGEHIAWAESSAVTFANAYLGARTNPENVSALAAAIIGKIPYYGLHKAENRIPNVIIDVNAQLSSETDFSLLGYLTAYKCSDLKFQYGAIPFFKGIKFATHTNIKNLSAGLATHGVHMFHIEGITPEWNVYEYKDIKERISIDGMDLKNFYNRFKINEPDLIIAGCPHTSVQELTNISKILKHCKLRKKPALWIFTARNVLCTAQYSGILKNILNAGAHIICDTCPVVMPLSKRFKYVISTSAKAMHYISAPTLNNIPTALLPFEKCISVCRM